jgi:hypothetical protein
MRLRLGLIPLAVGTALILALPTAALAAPTKVGTESFMSTQDINTPNGSPVVASGVINDRGIDNVISDTEDTFVFGTRGQVTVFHSPRHQNQKVNQKNCSFSFTERGTYVFGNGTGEWLNYNGSGKYTVTGHAVNACNGTPVGTVTIDAHGTINNAANQQ